MEWVESTGKTVEEAKDVALDRLGVHEDDAEFEVVSDVKTGLFGRIKEEARVRARVRPTTPRAKDDRRRQRGGRGRRGGRGGGDRKPSESRGSGERAATGNGGRSSNRPSGGKDRGRGATASKGGGEGREGRSGRGEHRADGAKEARPDTTDDKEKPVSDEATMPLTEQANLAQEFVAGLAERFGASVSFERAEIDDDIHLTVSGSDLGRMIGRRGSTALAIDELVRTVLQRQAGSSRDGRIRVDIGGVRARRTEALTRFCRDLAAEVRETGVARSLEPMGAADRKVVHDVITEEPGVDTISEGEDPNRRVVIVPIEDAD